MTAARRPARVAPGWAATAALLLGIQVLVVQVLGVQVLGAFLAPPLLADGKQPASGWWGDLDKGQGVRLEDVIEAPERHRGRSLTFTCVFHQQEREFNPLRTRFNAERYANISVWPDGTPLWKPKDFQRDFPFLYISRTHAHRDALLRVEPFTRLEVTARIEAVVDGFPFLEITGVRVTGHVLGRRIVDAMMRGEVYGRAPQPEQQALAAEQFEQALALQPDIAPLFALRIRERLAETYRALGRNADAERVLAGGASGRTGPVAPLPPESSFPPPLPAGGSLPGQPYEASAPDPGGTLPGVPYELPAQTPAASAAPGSRSVQQPAGPPSAGVPAAVPPRAVPPRAVQPQAAVPQPYDPGQPFTPSLPGVPVDPPSPRAAPRAAAPAVPAPKVVDPVLPAPPPGGGPPPRQPRLAGVK